MICPPRPNPLRGLRLAPTNIVQSAIRHIALGQFGEGLKGLAFMKAFAERHEDAVEVFARGPDTSSGPRPLRLIASIFASSRAAASLARSIATSFGISVAPTEPAERCSVAVG